MEGHILFITFIALDGRSVYITWIVVKAAFSPFKKVSSRWLKSTVFYSKLKSNLRIFSWSPWWWSSHSTVSLRCLWDLMIIAQGGFILPGGVVREYFCVCMYVCISHLPRKRWYCFNSCASLRFCSCWSWWRSLLLLSCSSGWMITLVSLVRPRAGWTH